MSVDESGEYELADTPEAEAPQPKAPPPAAQPLPRLWKAEPEERRRSRRRQKVRRRRGRRSRPRARPTRPIRRRKPSQSRKTKKQPPVAEGAEKKVLIEETPALDTYEARQRGRLVLGGLVAAAS